jgi:GMP synthase-like glutamine amidotransferase
LLLCEDDKQFAADVPRVWLRLLREKGNPEDWRIYRTAEKGELPRIDDDLHGVLIPGSSHSCYEDLPWIHRLREFVRECYIPLRDDHRSPQHEKKPQIVGSCFGAQLIAEALGGYVTRNPRGRYIVQAQEIFIQEAFARQPFAEGIILKSLRGGARFQPAPKRWSRKDDTSSLPFMRITETHGDSVLTLPADSQVLGTSSNITNEIFMVGKNMLCYQVSSHA